MSTPKFADVHNLVAFLSKPTEYKGFEQIIDLLNANPIKYALTVNPTIYTLCIEQFWATATAKNINREAQIHAKVDGKKVIISEATIRRDLKFDDEGGVDCLSNEVIFEKLPLIGIVQAQEELDEAVYKEMYDSVERAATTATGLDAKQDRGIISKTQFTETLNDLSSIGTSSGSGPRRQETMGDAAAQTRSARVSKFFNDPPLSRLDTLGSGEDRLQLKELMELYTKLSERVLNLETTKTTQAKVILSLKRRVKRLEKKKNLRAHRLKRLYKVGLSARVESSAKEHSLDKEDASKQGRNIVDIDADAETTLVDETAKDQKRYNDQEMFDTRVLDDEEVVVKKQLLLKKLMLLKINFDEVQKAFNKTMSWINSFVHMESEVVKDKVEGSEIRAEEDLQQESTKK
nr:hypothetical protein [Tanacetum cinerariifolium]